jgi:hypothetical protein
MAYTEIKKVREINGQQFIDDFKRVRTVVAYCYNTVDTFQIQRWEVWERAKAKKLHYFMSTDVYANRTEVLVIV